MANPSGQNSPVNWNGFVQNPPVYGDKQKQGDLQRSAPTAGSAAAALNAPRRAQKRASRPQRPQPAPVSVLPPPAPTGPPTQPVAYDAQLAATWAQISSIPGASPLVQQMAQEAQIGNQG